MDVSQIMRCQNGYTSLTIFLWTVNPENMLYTAYSHLNYAFAFINPKTYEIANMQDSDTEYMPRLTALKNYNPDLQVFVRAVILKNCVE